MTANTFETKIGGMTVSGEAHDLSAWFVVALRLMMGFAFATAGIDKLLTSFDASGYLLNVAATNGNPLAGLFAWMGSNATMVAFVNVAVPWGEFAIGLGLLFGVLTRLAAFWGAVMMLLFYFGNWDVAHGFVNGDFAYMLVFLTVAALGAGRLLGLDPFIEQLTVGGQALIERYPALEYVLG